MELYGETGCDKLGKYALAVACVFEVKVMYASIMSPYAHEPRIFFSDLSLFPCIPTGGPLFEIKVNECGSNCLKV